MPKPVKSAGPESISTHVSERGGTGGPAGPPRLELFTDKQRREVAMKAAKARWQSRAASERMLPSAATKPKRA
jgi:hypothetical protein